jgi:phage-related protein
MKRFLKALTVGLPLACGAAFSASSLAQAQQQEMPSADPQAIADRKRQIADLVNRAIPASRFPEIYADLRYAVREMYLPTFRDLLNDPKTAEADPESVRKLSAIVPLLEFGTRAAQEFDQASANYREALVEDIASLQAKYLSGDDIRFIGEALDAAATRKAFNAVYAFSRFLTGYDQEDIRSSREMTTWMKGWTVPPNAGANPFMPGGQVPTREKVAKAEAIISDLMRIARVDEVVSEIIGFMRNVVLEVETLKPEEIAAVRTGVEQFEFYYNLLKPMALAAMPSGLAAMLNDEQLGQYHRMILSPVMAKSFNLLHAFVREATSFSKQDIKEFRLLAEKGEKAKETARLSPEDEARMNAEWEALGGKWRERFMSSLTPETREGLEKATAAFSAMIQEEMAKQNETEEPTEELKDGIPSLLPPQTRPL